MIEGCFKAVADIYKVMVKACQIELKSAISLKVLTVRQIDLVLDKPSEGGNIFWEAESMLVEFRRLVINKKKAVLDTQG